MKTPRKKNSGKTKRIYLDFASTTPIDPQVVKAVADAMKVYGNAASLHEEGRQAKKIVDDSRTLIAGLLHASPAEIVFTAGGTEANNLALSGIVEHFKTAHPKVTPHIITTTIEHSSVLEVVKKLECSGAEVTFIKPDQDGRIDPKAVHEALRSNTLLVSVMYANNEIGTIEPVHEIAKVIRKFKSAHMSDLWAPTSRTCGPYFHVDAAQAASYCDLNMAKLGADLMTLDAGKIYGPKGTGLLYIKRGTPVGAELLGGGQEGGVRSGTENTPLIAGFAKALEITERIKEKESKRLVRLRDHFMQKLLANEGASINGSLTDRLPNNISVCIAGLDAEFAVYQLDERGIAVSSASTCMSLKEDSYSYVVEEVKPGECKTSTLRFSLGRMTTKRDIDVCLKALKEVVLEQKITR